MKSKILLLTAACIVTVAALAAIQGYFIYNTYKLKEKEVRDEIDKHLLDLGDTAVFDTINSNWMANTGSFSRDYIAKKVRKAAYANFISKNSVYPYQYSYNALSKIPIPFLGSRGNPYPNFSFIKVNKFGKIQKIHYVYIRNFFLGCYFL